MRIPHRAIAALERRSKRCDLEETRVGAAQPQFLHSLPFQCCASAASHGPAQLTRTRTQPAHRSTVRTAYCRAMLRHIRLPSGAKTEHGPSTHFPLSQEIDRSRGTICSHIRGGSRASSGTLQHTTQCGCDVRNGRLCRTKIYKPTVWPRLVGRASRTRASLGGFVSSATARSSYSRSVKTNSSRKPMCTSLGAPRRGRQVLSGTHGYSWYSQCGRWQRRGAHACNHSCGGDLDRQRDHRYDGP